MLHGIRRSILPFAAALLLGAGDNASAPKQNALSAPVPSGFSFTTFDVPGATSTLTVRSINASGAVVGYYPDAQNHQHGFMRDSNGLFTFIDVPGATDTFLTGVNDSGQISGWSVDASSNNANAFLRNLDGTLVPRVIPGANLVTGEGLNNLGQVVGTYGRSGVLFDASGNFSLFDVPQSLAACGFRGIITSATGINDPGQIVGTYSCPTGSSGAPTYAYERDLSGNYFQIVFSSGSPVGINNSGQIATVGYDRVGLVADSNGHVTYFKVPGEVFTAGGISNNGLVTGVFAPPPYPLAYHGYIGTPCVATITNSSATFGAAGGNGQIQVTAPAGCTWTAHFANNAFAYFSGADTGTGNGTVPFVVEANTQTVSQRQTTINVAGQIFTITQAGAPCSTSLAITSMAMPAAGGTSGFAVTAPAGCAWTAVSMNPDWLIVTNGAAGSGNGTVSFTALANTAAPTRTGTINAGGQTFYVNQAGGASCNFTVTPANTNFTAQGGASSVTVTTAGCVWMATSNSNWITITSGGPFTGNGTVTYTVAANTAFARSGSLTVAGVAVNVTQQAAAQPAGSVFVPVTPCRVMDTRAGSGKTGAFGPPRIQALTSRDIPIPASGCGIPATAQTYSLNVTVVPPGYLGYLSIWPAGLSRPIVSTLNAWDGRVVANAAVVPAGANGAVSLYVSNDTDVVIDINGYFDSAANPQGLVFYPVTPCRVADTRAGAGKTGQFGPPTMAGQSVRSFPLGSSGCGAPASAGAYSLNMTVVPPGSLGYLTTWPTGQSRPPVSTLNSWNGQVVASAAIVPAGTGGAISVYVQDTTDVIIDINGYFAPPGSPGGLYFYALSPCRVADTRSGGGRSGEFGPPIIAGQSARDFHIPLSGCGAPATSQAYSLNLTAVPAGYLGYLSTWPAGQTRPGVSTLNSWNGQVVANAALVPAGISGAVSVYVEEPTDLVIDINGFFAP